MTLISNLGHVGLICDDFLKMRDTTTMGLCRMVLAERQPYDRADEYPSMPPPP